MKLCGIFRQLRMEGVAALCTSSMTSRLQIDIRIAVVLSRLLHGHHPYPFKGVTLHSASSCFPCFPTGSDRGDNQHLSFRLGIKQPPYSHQSYIAFAEPDKAYNGCFQAFGYPSVHRLHLPYGSAVVPVNEAFGKAFYSMYPFSFITSSIRLRRFFPLYNLFFRGPVRVQEAPCPSVCIIGQGSGRNTCMYAEAAP